jgi:putative glutamine amidotransferase
MTRPATRRPIVGVPSDAKLLGQHPFHAVGEKYLAAVEIAADCMPIMLPALLDMKTGEPDISEILAVCDGILLTGSPSNVHPKHYGGPAPREHVLLDEKRDALTLALIRAAASMGTPVFCICRGFQEMNVAFGGTLHQHLEEAESLEGFTARHDHRENKTAPLDTQYGPAHQVLIEKGGLFERLFGARSLTVNSLHGQGIDRLAPGLRIEARAGDGTIEAASLPSAKNFVAGVQWHPEWKFWENPDSQIIFRAFGDAVRDAAAARIKHAESKVLHGVGQ